MAGRPLGLFLLVLLVLAPSVQSTVDPHPRGSPTQALAGPITAMAMASNTGAVLAGMADPQRSFPDAGAANVWTLWDANGNLQTTDDADENNCVATLLEPCIGDVIDLAVSADGLRIVVASRGQNAAEGRVRFFTRDQGPVANLEFAVESPTSVAMSSDGTRVALGLLRPGGGTGADTGRVRTYSWSGSGAGTVTAGWTADVAAGPITDVAITADGRVAAGAADRHYRFSASGSPFMHDTEGTVGTVAFSATSAHWSVAGTSTGLVSIYSDAQDTATPQVAYQSNSGVAQNAVAISADGKLFIGGDAGGQLRLFRNPDLVSIPSGQSMLVATSSGLDGPVTALQMSADARYVAVAAGKGTYLFRIGEDQLSEIWRNIGGATVSEVGISLDGNYVASASGTTVTVFTVVHSVAVEVPNGVTAAPGIFRNIPLFYINTGNREETVPLTLSLPADWIGSLSDTSFSIAADASKTIILNVTPPAAASPGPYNVVVTHRVQGIPTSTTVPIQVGQLRQWTLQPDGAINRPITAGGSVQFPLDLSNLGNGEDTTDIQVTIDTPSWAAAVTPDKVTLARGADGSATLVITAPQSAQHLEKAAATVRLTADPTASLRLTATVGARFGLSAGASPASSTIAAGAPTHFTITISNTGNAPDTFVVTPTLPPAGWDIQLDVTELNEAVAAGASVEVPVTATPPAGAAGSSSELRFTVKSLGDTLQQVIARHTVTVPAAPTTDPPQEETPGPSAIALVAGLAALAVFLRRR